MEAIKEHEYLLKEDHYEIKHIQRGRVDKTCECCGKLIPIGEPHDMHKFYPDFRAYPVHEGCHDKFMKSLNV